MTFPDDDNPTTQRTVLSTGPAPQSGLLSACVVVIHGEGLGQRLDIGPGPVTIGRSHDADLHIAHISVSRLHCRIWRDQEGYRIRDLNATNPTRLNDVALAQSADCDLADGDQITVGETILKFISHASVEARYHEEVYQLATHDALTELCNRRHFIEQLDKEIARAERHDRKLVACIIDVDLFKQINDTCGHIAGDTVLRQLAELLRKHVREDEVAARIGGEEFAVLFPEADLEAAAHFAERYREAVEQSDFRIHGASRRITVSIGLAELSGERRSRAALLGAADAALYRAKTEGRNRVRCA